MGANERLIAANLLARVRIEEPQPTLQPCFSPQQVSLLLQKADAFDQPVFAVMAYSGMRFGEVRDLCWTDLLLDQGRYGFVVVQRGGSAGKTKGIRRLLEVFVSKLVVDLETKEVEVEFAVPSWIGKRLLTPTKVCLDELIGSRPLHQAHAGAAVAVAIFTCDGAAVRRRWKGRPEPCMACRRRAA